MVILCQGQTKSYFLCLVTLAVLLNVLINLAISIEIAITVHAHTSLYNSCH